MDKGLLFLTLGAVCFWLVFDDIVGKQRISALASKLTPVLPSVGGVVGNIIDGAKDVADGSSNLLPKVTNPSDPNKDKNQAIDNLPKGRQDQADRYNKK